MPAVITPLSRYISRKIKQLWNLSSLAKNFNLSITKQEHLHNQIIGLDSVKRKLLILKKEGGRVVCCIVHLKDLQSCSIKKIYSSISAGSLRKKKLENYLQSVSLHLFFKSGTQPVTLNFYKRKYNNIGELPFWETAAKKWEHFVSNLSSRPMEVRST